jgi:transposase
MKNPYHLSIRPQFHWTDQKIKVHFFICVLGYLLTTLVQHRVKAAEIFEGNMDNLLDELNRIRLATLLEKSKKPGRVKARYTLEKMTPRQQEMAKALSIEDFHIKRPNLMGLGVYN